MKAGVIRPSLRFGATLVTLLGCSCGRIGYELTDVANGALAGGTGGASGADSAGAANGAAAGTLSPMGGAAGALSSGGSGAGQAGSGPVPCVDASTYPGGGFYKADISEVSGMTLNGSAATTAGLLRLVPASPGGGGSAFLDTPLSIPSETSLFAHFSFRIGGGDGTQGGDGLAFVLQNAGPAVVGRAGGGLGYDDIGESVAIQFDPHFNQDEDPADNHIALTLHGSVLHLAHTVAPFDINDNVRRYVWISFDSLAQLLEVFVSETPTQPSSPILTHPDFRISKQLIKDTYVGFTAASGEAHNDHDLLGEAWIVTSQYGRCR